jgi:hypothetical protein
VGYNKKNIATAAAVIQASEGIRFNFVYEGAIKKLHRLLFLMLSKLNFRTYFEAYIYHFPFKQLSKIKNS